LDCRYEVQLEIAGPAAMFSRPDTGATPISYPVPTWSAARGMFDAVLRRPHIYVHPTSVEICAPIQFERYVTNYGGPLRKPAQIKDDNNYQLIATILVDVCYRIRGEVRMKKMSSRGKGREQQRTRRGQDWRPKFQKIFEERMVKGQTFYTPCLGWKEFVPRYFGLFRPETKRDENVNETIPSFLRSMWEHRQFNPKYVQDWQVVRGLMSYLNHAPTEEEFHVE